MLAIAVWDERTFGQGELLARDERSRSRRDEVRADEDSDPADVIAPSSCHSDSGRKK